MPLSQAEITKLNAAVTNKALVWYFGERPLGTQLVQSINLAQQRAYLTGGGSINLQSRNVNLDVFRWQATTAFEEFA